MDDVSWWRGGGVRRVQALALDTDAALDPAYRRLVAAVGIVSLINEMLEQALLGGAVGNQLQHLVRLVC